MVPGRLIYFKPSHQAQVITIAFDCLYFSADFFSRTICIILRCNYIFNLTCRSSLHSQIVFNARSPVHAHANNKAQMSMEVIKDIILYMFFLSFIHRLIQIQIKVRSRSIHQSQTILCFSIFQNWYWERKRRWQLCHYFFFFLSQSMKETFCRYWRTHSACVQWRFTGGVRDDKWQTGG